MKEKSPRPTKWGEAGANRVQRMAPVRGGADLTAHMLVAAKV